MRVYVKEDGKKHVIFVPIPSILIFNHINALLVPLVFRRSAAKRGVNINIRLAMRLVNTYWHCRIRYPGWKLVDIKSGEDRVLVKL